jgi:hypothetical protein
MTEIVMDVGVPLVTFITLVGLLGIQVRRRIKKLDMTDQDVLDSYVELTRLRRKR